MNFIDKNIFISIYIENYCGKINNLNKLKKIDDVSFIPIELSTKFIALVQSVCKIACKSLTLFIMSIIKRVTNRKIHLYFLASSKTVHFLIVLLIFFFTDKITDGLKNH